MCPKFFGFYFIPQWGCDYKTVHYQLAYVLCSGQPIVQMSWPECRVLSSAKQILFKNLNTRKNTQNSDGIWILETSVRQAGQNMINFMTHEFFYTNFEGKFWFFNLTSVKCIIINNWSVPFLFFSEKLKINKTDKEGCNCFLVSLEFYGTSARVVFVWLFEFFEVPGNCYRKAGKWG